MVLDIINKIILKLGDPYFIFIYLSYGYLNGNKLLCERIISQSIIAMIFNILLKEYFQILPLDGLKGFSFPSGHVHFFTITIYNLILYYKHKLIVTIYCFILAIIYPLAIINAKYHYLIDTIGGYTYGALTVYLYYIYQQYKDNIYSKYVLLFFTILLCIISFMIQKFLIISCLLSLSMFKYFDNKNKLIYKKFKSLVLCAFLIFGGIIASYISKINELLTLPIFIIMISYIMPLIKDSNYPILFIKKP